jgi:hypothetical protein
VTLAVYPPKALVFRAGKFDGVPPLSYSIKKGERVVVRVDKPGYVGRTVILDGKTPTVSVSLKEARVDKPQSE